MKIDVKGTIISNDEKWAYDWFGMDAVCPKDVSNAIDDASGEALDVYINSGGGDLIAGNEIYAALEAYSGEVRVHVVGLAASAASVIACAGKSDITPGGMLMIHNVSSCAGGDYHTMDRASERLQTANRAVCAVYRKKTGMTEQQLLDEMDRETWMTAEDAVNKGFIDSISGADENRLVAASFFAPMLSKTAIQNARSQLPAVKKATAEIEILKLMGVKTMTKETYISKRQALLDDAKALVESGKLKEFEDKKSEIEKLDSDFESEAKAMASLNAMSQPVHVANLADISKGVSGQVVDSMGAQEEPDDLYGSVEYRKAFMRNVLSGERIPEKFRNADANTKTSDVGAVIPTTIMEKIIENMETTGNIIPLVTRTSYQGGLSIPKSTVKPTATWVSEGAGSDKQKKTASTSGAVSFNYYKLRCAISMSLEVTVTALPVFEATFVANVTEAMTKALEQAIISGDGSGKPKGILTETANGTVTVAKTGKLTYATLTEAEGKLPLAYESGAVWLMSKATFMAFHGMVDNAGQPIARVNYGIGGAPERSLLGRTVILNDYMSNYADTVTSDTIFAALFNMKDYVLNTNYQMTVKQYEDNDTDDQVIKAVMLVDGKVVDTHSLVTLTKASA